ncbi:hypothetical protein EKL30_03555 [Candidimonas sp. SYP-B2681]|uniref:DUF6998 domain-containing protein n=1 Tax=Candidimonas sp. SYP-B2681 TaxID=2497686 RepID=UPI000F88E858|nr:hypothetical protein [Candidimonas sp. SYP-B2681]RTZ48051.1 hypothetical protein EKL30_03555 [Candidimonas sp. SYP-B2681]
MEIEYLSVQQLLELHCDAIAELRHRGVLRTKNNPVGDYAEWLVSVAFGLTLANNSSADYDAISKSGKKIQIKARRVTVDNKSRQLGVLRNLEAQGFDELIIVIFDGHFQITNAYSLPHSVAVQYSTYKPHVNGHILHARGALLTDPRLQDVSAELRAVAIAHSIQTP